eukprot:SAG11_NODE_3273_length_2561_cov_1.925670_3_plen_152_part_00
MKREHGDLIVQPETRAWVGTWSTASTAASFLSDEVRLLPSTQSLCGQLFCLRTRIEFGGSERKRSGGSFNGGFVWQETVIAVVRSEGADQLRQLVRYMSGDQCIAQTVRFYRFKQREIGACSTAVGSARPRLRSALPPPSLIRRLCEGMLS